VQMAVQRVVQRSPHERFVILTPAWGRRAKYMRKKLKRVFTNKFTVGQTVWYVCAGSNAYGTKGIVLEVDPESYTRSPQRNPYRVKWEAFAWAFWEIEDNLTAENPNRLYREVCPLNRDVDGPGWVDPDKVCPGWRDRPATKEQREALRTIRVAFSEEITSGEAEALIKPWRIQRYRPHRIDESEVVTL